MSKHDEKACVADMAVVIDGDAAHVHPHPSRDERREGFLASSEAVVNPEHRPTPVSPRAVASRASTRAPSSSYTVASSGPDVAAVSAARSGMYSALSFLPVDA
jgi:hypothetical protein